MKNSMLYFEGLIPSPCGHSPYLIYDEQRERIESITLTVFTPSEIYGDSPPPLCFAQQNIGEVSEGRRGKKNAARGTDWAAISPSRRAP